MTIPPSSDAVEKAKRLLELHEKATQGEWAVSHDDAVKIKDGNGDSLLCMFHIHLRGRRDGNEVNATADLIATAHNDLPAIATAFLTATTDNAKLRERVRVLEEAIFLALDPMCTGVAGREEYFRDTTKSRAALAGLRRALKENQP